LNASTTNLFLVELFLLEHCHWHTHQTDTTTSPVTASADEKDFAMLSIFPKSPRTVVWMGIALHLTYLLAMFDTFFHSPIVHVGTHHLVSPSNQEPLAERVVLMVGE
jgi:hypothetical protein